MKEITYLLCKNNDNSNKYYEIVSAFTDEVVKNINNISGKYINEFMKYIYENKIENLRSKPEYILEILMLGVFWENYINKALCLKKIPKYILIKLAYLRKRQNLKKIIDSNRGILSTLFLNKDYNKKIDLTSKNIEKLIEYLNATGEFKEEVKRLKIWEEYLETKSKEEVKELLSTSLIVSNYFEKNSIKTLDCYTENVDRFLQEVHKSYKWREDFIYCGRKKVEYHMNMVGAEIMNRAYREDFLEAEEKRLLLPACMRIKDEKNCKAVKTREGYICASCSKLCNVNRYHNLGKEYNFKVYIIPHESNISVDEKNKYKKIGIIGVACVLNLISGGLKAKDLGFEPQCVLLDFCGCKSHWHDEGIITDINRERLFYILGV